METLGYTYRIAQSLKALLLMAGRGVSNCFLVVLHCALQGLHYVLQGLHYVLQGLHYVLQGLHYVLQGLHYVLQGLHCVLLDVHYVLQALKYVMEAYNYQSIALHYNRPQRQSPPLSAHRIIELKKYFRPRIRSPSPVFVKRPLKLKLKISINKFQ